MYAGRVLEKKPLDMRDFDPLAVVKVARRHLETIREPRRRQILEVEKLVVGIFIEGIVHQLHPGKLIEPAGAFANRDAGGGSR